MGHSVYLLIRSGDEEAEAFVATNFLPWFWLTLLDRNALAAAAPMWHEWDRLLQAGDEAEIERFDDVWPMLTDLWLAPAEVAANAARARLLLQNHAELAALHDEFVAYLLTQMPADGDSLRLGLLALSGFSSAASQLAAIEAQLVGLEQDASLPVADWYENQSLLTGFATRPVPLQQYPALHRASAPAARPVAPESLGPTGRARSYRISGLAALLGLFLLYASWRGYHHEHLSFAVGLTALLGLAFLAGAVVRQRYWRRNYRP